MNSLKKTVAAMALGIATLTGGQAQAAIPVYPDSGTENPLLYTFTAASTGDLYAYFASGAGAGNTNLLGVLVNNIDRGILALNNHTSAVGDSQNFGLVNAGDILTFYIDVNDGDETFYSDKSRNIDGENHVWSVDYDGSDPLLPAGVFVAFEDLDGRDFSDHNYDDLSFVFTNVTTTVGAIPEPSTWALMLLGFGGLGAAMRRKNARLQLRYA